MKKSMTQAIKRKGTNQSTFCCRINYPFMTLRGNSTKPTLPKRTLVRGRGLGVERCGVVHHRFPLLRKLSQPKIMVTIAGCIGHSHEKT